MLKVYDVQGQLKDVVKKFSTRKTEISKQVNDTVMEMIDNVEKNGDQAIMKYCRQLDGFMIENPQDLLVSKQEILDGVTAVGKDFMRILERTKEQLTDFHQHQVDRSWSIYKENGVMMGQVVRGLEKVALYVLDNGPGIPEADLPFIFDKGFTGERGSMMSRSTGMGLYLARKMADDLSIELRAESTPGCGTAMILYFSVVKLCAPSLELI